MLTNVIRFISNGVGSSDSIKERFLKIALENGFVEYDQTKNSHPSIVMAIGGDGCFLRAVQETGFLSNTYYMGYNTGHVGFLQDSEFSDDDFIKLLNCVMDDYNRPHIVRNTFSVTDMYVLYVQIKAERNGKTFYIERKVVNDIEVSNTTRKTFKADLYLNDELLEEFSGDAVLVSSSTGSTAHAMNAGGAIIVEELPIMELVPMQAARSSLLKNLINPMITSKVIRIVPSGICYTQVDGMTLDEVSEDEIKEIRVSVANQRIKRVHISSSANKITTIKKKFLEMA